VDLSVLIANHNTSRFLEVSLQALHALTRRPFEVLINDDGSEPSDVEALERLAGQYPAVGVFRRPSRGGGSLAHGEALDFLFSQVSTPYTAVLDADCTPLMAGWDEYLIGELGDTVKIVGSTLGEAWSGNKATDFPLPFLALFETATYRDLGISALPGDRSTGQDTCWEWREKFRAAGYAGKTLESLNTRIEPRQPFAHVICGLYYTDDGRLIGSHFGRGSNPGARSPRSGGRIGRLLRRGRPGTRQRRQTASELAEWKRLCGELISAQPDPRPASSPPPGSRS
jgi:glycosyltransferase involved in cell wall biosynthesis